MNGDRSDLFSNLELTHYDRLHTTFETALTKENQNFDATINTAANSHASEKGIMFALGFIATLLLFSGLQLYRCVNLNPIQPKAIMRSRPLKIVPNRAITFKDRNSTTEVPANKFNRFDPSHKVKTLGIQNTISQGKF